MFSRVFGIPQRYGLTAFRNGVASFAFDLKAGEPYRSLTRFSKFYNLKKKKKDVILKITKVINNKTYLNL